MGSPVFRLSPASTEEAFDQIQSQVSDAEASGEKNFILALDGIPVLDSAVIRRLVKLLRRARESGGDLTLAVSRQDLLRTLQVTALDKIFHVIPSAEAA